MNNDEANFLTEEEIAEGQAQATEFEAERKRLAQIIGVDGSEISDSTFSYLLGFKDEHVVMAWQIEMMTLESIRIAREMRRESDRIRKKAERNSRAFMNRFGT